MFRAGAACAVHTSMRERSATLPALASAGGSVGVSAAGASLPRAAMPAAVAGRAARPGRSRRTQGGRVVVAAARKGEARSSARWAGRGTRSRRSVRGRRPGRCPRRDPRRRTFRGCGAPQRTVPIGPRGIGTPSRPSVHRTAGPGTAGSLINASLTAALLRFTGRRRARRGTTEGLAYLHQPMSMPTCSSRSLRPPVPHTPGPGEPVLRHHPVGGGRAAPRRRGLPGCGALTDATSDCGGPGPGREAPLLWRTFLPAAQGATTRPRIPRRTVSARVCHQQPR